MAINVSKLLNEGVLYLQKKNISEAKINCEWILAKVLNMGRLELFVNLDVKIDKADADKFRKLIAAKARGMPISYIFREHDFMGLKLSLSRNVLIPRPETEELAGLAIKHARKSEKKNIKIIDFGTGSGCIALALARDIKNCEITAIDKSKAALKCAGKNIKKFGFQKKIRCIEASSVLAAGGKCDMIVSNPPYIPSELIGGLDEEVQFEPKMALDGGNDGLKIVKEIIKDAPEILLKGDRVFFEIEENQSAKLASLIDRGIWSEIVFHKDYNNKRRFLELGMC